MFHSTAATVCIHAAIVFINVLTLHSMHYHLEVRDEPGLRCCDTLLWL